MWHRVVAENEEQNAEFICIVPEHWIVSKTPADKFVCWPPKHKESKAKYDVNMTPDSMWQWYPHIKTLFSDNDKKLCEDYDISTDDQQRTPSISKKTKKSSIKSKPTVTKSISENSEIQTPIPPPQFTLESMTSRSYQTGSSTPRTPRTQNSSFASDAGDNYENRSYDLLKKILKRQSVLEAKMDLVLAKSDQNALIQSALAEYRLPEPMAALVDIHSFELEYRKNDVKMEKALTLKCKVKDVGGSVRGVLSSLMKDSLMCQFNMQGADRSGQIKKEAFVKSFMKTIVVNVVGKFHDCLEEQVLKAVSEFLKHAPKRVKRKITNEVQNVETLQSPDNNATPALPFLAEKQANFIPLKKSKISENVSLRGDESSDGGEENENNGPYKDPESEEEE